MRQLFSRTLLVAAIAGLAACGGGEPPTDPTVPAITLTLSGQSLTLAQGASGTLTATIARTDFDGAVALTAEGAPAGVTVSFAPASLSGTASASTITVAAGASAATGTHTITIRAAGSGITAKTATVALTISATGGYSLSIAPTSVSMSQGASGAATVTVARSGSFTGAVNLTVTGAPTGMTATFTPASVPTTGTTSSLAISTTASTPVGAHTLTVRGNATGMTEQTVTLTVNVTAATAGTQLTITFCADEAPIWLAYQNDGGAWTSVTGTATHSYTFTMTSSKGGVALVRGSATEGYDTEVIYATATEFSSFASAGNAQGCVTGSGKTLSGTVAGLTATQDADINMSEGYASVSGSNPPLNYSMSGIANGPRDLVAVRFNAMADYTADKVIVRRGLDLPSGSTIPVLDFAAAEAVAPASASLTIAGAGATDTKGAFTSFATANGTFATLSFPDYSTSSTATVYGVPASKVIAGDFHETFAYAENAEATAARYVIMFTQQLTTRTLTLGAELATPTVTTVSATAPVRIRMVAPVQADYSSIAFGGFMQNEAGGNFRYVNVAMTAAYRGSATNWDLSVPDFGAAAGFSATWGLRAGVAYEWDFFAQNVAVLDFPAPTEGLTVKMAQRYSAAPATPFVQGSARDRAEVKQLRPRTPFQAMER